MSESEILKKDGSCEGVNDKRKNSYGVRTEERKLVTALVWKLKKNTKKNDLRNKTEEAEACLRT